MIDYAQILSANYAGTQWSLNGNSYDGLTWLDESPKPTKVELDALWEPTKSLIASKAYIAQRQAEYPPIGDQLDALWKGGQAADDMLAQVQAVKAKYPKA